LAIFDEELGSKSAPAITAQVVEPGGETKSIAFQPLVKGRFEATINDGRPGDYKIEISYGTLKLPPLAITLSGELFGEIPGKGINYSNLSKIAQFGNGLINPKPEQVSATSRTTLNKKELFPPLIVLAFILIILEAFIRELDSSILSRFSSRNVEDSSSSRFATQGNYQTRDKMVDSKVRKTV
jgi:hypothetical protein